MANRQDSGSGSAHQNERPNANDEGSIPEMIDDTRNMSDESDDDELDDSEDLDEEEEDDEAKI